MFAPIILFVYNRPWHTQLTVEALQRNDLAAESELFVFCDGPKETATEEQKAKIKEVREYVHNIKGFKNIHIEESEQNKGLANSVIAGVTKIINEYGKVIVVEDDIVTHPFFLRFMNECLDVYEQRQDIFMIGGYNVNIAFPWWYRKDVYVVHRSCSWGWATWKNRWAQADWAVQNFQLMCDNSELQALFNRGGNDMFPMLKAQMEGKIDSWAIRWDYSMYRHDALCVRPVKSLCDNCGMDGSGVHCGPTNQSLTAPKYDKQEYDMALDVKVAVKKHITSDFAYFYSCGGCRKPPLLKRGIRKMKAFLK